MMRQIFGLTMLFLAWLVPIGISEATETINTDVVASLDPYGDGSMKMTFHLSASQWAVWKQQYGDHPDVLWRDLKQKFAKYALEKFDIQKNEVERTATADIEARAFTRVRGDGTRGIEIPKEFRLVSNSGREWVFDFTTQESPYSPILAQMSRVILPADATNAHIEQPGTGFQQLVYQMPDNSSGNILFLWTGISAMAGGVILWILGLMFSRPA
ncbi:MAG: hypothetical protein JO251_15625 [Verrucomicrobia bacterium]|nr:hypothetical protein [Verrucomicrobiota bacterium]MBV8640994.1 hypothetical protein [Verrucomicrobiota bacterium]